MILIMMLLMTLLVIPEQCSFSSFFSFHELFGTNCPVFIEIVLKQKKITSQDFFVEYSREKYVFPLNLCTVLFKC